jgi:hypothetical protein
MQAKRDYLNTGIRNKLWTISLFIIVVFWTQMSSANVGVFSGDGFTVELQKSAQIQMVSENVSFKFVGAALSRVYSPSNKLPGDYAHVNGVYTLKNLTDSIVRVQVGFPLNSDHVRGKNIDGTHSKEAESSSFPGELERTMEFVVRDSAGKYPLRYIAQDEKQRYKGVFLWEMIFAPRELKVLQVRYEIELSFTLADMDTIYSPYAKDWYEALNGAYLEYFEYVTETAKSWAGPVEKAVFRAEIADFKLYLFNRGVFEQSYYDSWQAEASADSTRRMPPPSNHTLIKDCISPKGWHERDGKVEWSFENYAADSNLSFQFWLSIIPREPSGIDTLVSLLFGQYPRSEDLSDLREIIAAFMGIPPQTERVTEFAKRQVWYATQRWKTEDSLSIDERRLITYIARLEQNSVDRH